MDTLTADRPEWETWSGPMSLAEVVIPHGSSWGAIAHVPDPDVDVPTALCNGISGRVMTAVTARVCGVIPCPQCFRAVSRG
jgi:hypothetical protein